MVLGHAIILFPVNLHENFLCKAIFDWLSSVHMPLFFVIAGFCYSCRDYKAYLRKKFFRLAVPYIVFNMIDMLPRQLLASLVRRPKPMSESIIKMLLYGGEFWFIYTLFIIFMIYPLLAKLMNSGKSRMIIASVLLFLLSCHGVGIRLFNLVSAAYYMFFFHLGVMVKVFCDGKLPVLRVPVYVLPMSLCLWLVMLFSVEGFGVITALLGILTCCLMARYTLFNDTFSRFGGYSLQLYLLNGITLGISRAIICNLMHVYNPAAIIVFNMLVDFLASYLFIKHVCAKSKVIRLAMGMV